MFMRHLAIIALIALAISGCGQPAANESTAVSPDNTGVNIRDRDVDVKTPIDQNENQTDIDITANIRKRVVATKMSVDAQNVKIITQDGKVTLRGPVKSAEEKKQIEDIAQAVAGADKVVSQLEVEKQP
jgi:osmotically-inducible protein OsmY